jgi:hypothetical protein
VGAGAGDGAGGVATAGGDPEGDALGGAAADGGAALGGVAAGGSAVAGGGAGGGGADMLAPSGVGASVNAIASAGPNNTTSVSMLPHLEAGHHPLGMADGRALTSRVQPPNEIECDAMSVTTA